jgi:hypothetical protein
LPGAIDRILRLERGRIVASAMRSTPMRRPREHARAARRPAQRSRAATRPRGRARRRGIAGRRFESAAAVEIENASIRLGSRRVSETSIGESTRGNNGS